MYLYVEDVEFFFIFDLLSDWLLNKNSGTCGYIMINIELKANIETKDSIFLKSQIYKYKHFPIANIFWICFVLSILCRVYLSLMNA